MRELRWKAAGNPEPPSPVVATDAELTKAQAKRLAIAANGGCTRRSGSRTRTRTAKPCSRPGRRGRRSGRDRRTFIEIGAAAADCLARAIARGVYEATALPCCPDYPAWRDRFGAGRAAT
jgi:D-aminopeptidase